ncbi:MAG: hypothetical protein JWP48_6912 [Actinoallomurus sp.]|jgi:hypothetical protein|nr:hypothetical protein [Actinoallomurus sp.]
MEENSPSGPPWSAEVRTDCPVALPAQAWIEGSMRWFIEQFGRQAALGQVALLVPDFLPAAYTGTPEQVEALVFRIRDLMSVDASQRLIVRHFDGSDEALRGGRRTVGHYQEENGQAIIALDEREAADAAFLTAIIAHELGHVRLLGERRLDHDRRDHERLTDLLTIYLGFGVFTANAALSFSTTARNWSVQPRGYLSEQTLHGAHNDGYARLGYLSEPEFGYALACYAWLRGESAPPWAAHLDPGPRGLLRQGLAYLAGCAPQGEFPTLAGSGRISISVVPRMRSSAISFLILVFGEYERRLHSQPTWPVTGVRPRCQ